MGRGKNTTKFNQIAKRTLMENNTPPEVLIQTSTIVDDQNTKMIDVTNMVPVDKAELQALIDQNSELKQEIGALVGLFLNFKPLFKDDVNLFSLGSIIPKLLHDPKIKTEVGAILPIIEKYSV